MNIFEVIADPLNTRNDIVPHYKEFKGNRRAINQAIVNRWSESSLSYIRQKSGVVSVRGVKCQNVYIPKGCVNGKDSQLPSNFSITSSGKRSKICNACRKYKRKYTIEPTNSEYPQFNRWLEEMVVEIRG